MLAESIRVHYFSIAKLRYNPFMTSDPGPLVSWNQLKWIQVRWEATQVLRTIQISVTGWQDFFNIWPFTATKICQLHFRSAKVGSKFAQYKIPTRIFFSKSGHADPDRAQWDFDFVSLQHKKCSKFGAGIAQWIRLRLPSCGPRFKSQTNHLRFFHLKWNVELYLFFLVLRKGRK